MCAIRYPHKRRSRKTAIASRTKTGLERVLLSISFCGLGIDFADLCTDRPAKSASYSFSPTSAWPAPPFSRRRSLCFMLCTAIWAARGR